MLAAFWIVVGLRRLLLRRSLGPAAGPGWLPGRLASPWRPLLLAVPTTLILWAGHRLIGLDAMMDRMNSFVPEPCRLLHNAIFFVVGVYLHRFRHDLARFAAHRWTYLALSIPVFACRALLIRRDLRGPSRVRLSWRWRPQVPCSPGSSPSGSLVWPWDRSTVPGRRSATSQTAPIGSICVISRSSGCFRWTYSRSRRPPH